MASFTVKLFEIDSAVSITGGPFAGHSGRVVNWAHIGQGVPDTIHIVRLDGGEVVEVPASELRD